LPRAERVRHTAWAISVVLVVKPQQEGSISNRTAGLVTLVRSILYGPALGWHAAAEPGTTLKAPTPNWRTLPQDHARDELERLRFGATEIAVGRRYGRQAIR
jgi:hypothetical protein